MAEHWWVNDSGIAPCPECGTPIQRTTTGTVADGMRAHFSYCHPGQTVPVQIARP